MQDSDLALIDGETYEVTYRCRDIGYGVEEGTGSFAYLGVEPYGKRIFQPQHGETIYLFDDEILSADNVERWESEQIQNRLIVHLPLGMDISHAHTLKDAISDTLRNRYGESWGREGGWSVVMDIVRDDPQS